MKKAALFLALIASLCATHSAFAADDVVSDDHCQDLLQTYIASTTDKNLIAELKALSDDFKDYNAQTKWLSSAQGTTKAEAAQAQQDTWQSIVYDYQQLKASYDVFAIYVNLECQIEDPTSLNFN